jgi:hypothetical protein
MHPLTNLLVKLPSQDGAISWLFVEERFAPGRAGMLKPSVTTGSTGRSRRNTTADSLEGATLVDLSSDPFAMMYFMGIHSREIVYNRGYVTHG